LHIETIREHVENFSLTKEFDVSYIPIDRLPEHGFDAFDVIVVHYAIRLAFKETLPNTFIELLQNYNGTKVIFIQDEYDNTEDVRKIFENIRPNLVFTCVPEENIEWVYPQARFPNTKFVNVLTGFAPSVVFGDINSYANRKIDIGYRGRIIGHRYGKLGFDKWRIGVEVKEKAKSYPSLVLDISSYEEDRIYGKDWFDFLLNCKSVLASESGSNVFDFDGSIRKTAERESHLGFKEFYSAYLENIEIDGLMNQISPRIFEAAATKTLLILFEGNYSNIISPEIHYLSLKKDLSNFDEIVSKLRDENLVNKITQKSYEDLILSENFGAEAYFKKIFWEISKIANESSFVSSGESSYQRLPLGADQHLQGRVNIAERKFLGHKIIRFLWRLIPFNFRIKLLSRFNKFLGSLRG
jgi:hypothetical protein